jgi:syntaxin-binding protein 1
MSTFCYSGKGKLQSSGSFDEDSEYASSRYVPTLKAILQELVANQLSIEEYPSVVPMPDMPSVSTSATSARRRGKGAETSARKKKGATDKWSRTGASPTTSTASANYAGGRNLVFVVGGMCYSELRVAREVMEKESREIVVGSTSFISPADFINDLATLTGN